MQRYALLIELTEGEKISDPLKFGSEKSFDQLVVRARKIQPEYDYDVGIKYPSGEIQIMSFEEYKKYHQEHMEKVL